MNQQFHVTQTYMKQVFAKIRKLLKSGELQNIKQVIDLYVNRIDVYPEKVIVGFNFFPNINLDITKEDCEQSSKNDKGDSSNELSPDFQQYPISQNTVDFGGEGGIRTLAALIEH